MAERWYGGADERWRQEHRGPMDRTSDEVRSWMGDDRAEMRRELDKRDDWREQERERERERARERERELARGREHDRDFRYYAPESPVRGYEPGATYNAGSYRPSSDRGFYGLGPKGYKRSDQRTLEDVCDRLTEDPHVDASNIEVRCERGVVTLTGSVNSREQKRHAEDIVERTLGVDDVNNNIRVSPGVIGTPGTPHSPLGLSPDVSPEPQRRS